MYLNYLKCNRLKGTFYYFSGDFTKEMFVLCIDLWKEVEALREEGKIAYLNYKTIYGGKKMKFRFKTNITCLD